MRRIFKYIVLALAIAVFALPMGALAETLQGANISLVNPVLSVNDEPFMDLNGIAIGLLGAISPNGQTAVAQLHALAGEETALSAMGEMSDGHVVFYIDGMRDKYALSGEGIVQNLNFGGILPGAAGIASSAQNLASPELLEDLAVAINDFVSEAMSGVEDGGYETITLISKEEEMRVTELTLTAEQMNDLLVDIFARLDEEEGISALLTAFGVESDEDFSFLKAFEASGIQEDIEAAFAVGEETGDFSVQALVNLSAPQNGQDVAVSLRAMIEDNPRRFYADADVSVGGELQQGFYVAGETAEDGLSLELGNGSYEDGEYVSSHIATLNCAPEEIDGHAGTTVHAEYTGAQGWFSLDGQGYVMDSAFSLEAALQAMNAAGDNIGTMTVAIDGEGGEDLVNGSLALGYYNPSSELWYGFSTDYALQQVALEDTDVLLGADGAVDVLNMDEKTASRFMAELGGVALSALGVISENVPGLGALLGLFTGLGL